MNLLLDTHAFIWLAGDPTKLSASASAALQDTSNTLFFSVASIWEMQIKLQLGKLALPRPLPELVANQQQVNGLQLLPIEPTHIYALDTLPSHHKDPFDRLLVAQTSIEQLTLVTTDSVFKAYGVPLLW